MRNLRSHRRRRTRVTLTTVLISVLAVAGCGGSGEESASSPSADEVPALHDALPQSVKDAGVLRFADYARLETRLSEPVME